MKKWLFAILLGSALVLGACGDDGAKEDDGGGTTELSAGEEAYQKNSCMTCHGDDLDGGPVDLNTIGSKLSAEEIEDVIENGSGGMPAQKGVSAEDRTLLAEWLADKK